MMCKWKKNYYSLTDIWFYQTIFHMDCLVWNCKLLCNNCNLIKAIVNSTLGSLDQKIVKTEILSQGPVQILSRDFFLTMKLKFLAFRVKLLHKSCTSKILKWFDSSENKNICIWCAYFEKCDSFRVAVKFKHIAINNKYFPVAAKSWRTATKMRNTMIYLIFFFFFFLAFVTWLYTINWYFQ